MMFVGESLVSPRALTAEHYFALASISIPVSYLVLTSSLASVTAVRPSRNEIGLIGS